MESENSNERRRPILPVPEGEMLHTMCQLSRNIAERAAAGESVDCDQKAGMPRDLLIWNYALTLVHMSDEQFGIELQRIADSLSKPEILVLLEKVRFLHPDVGTGRAAAPTSSLRAASSSRFAP